MSNPEIEEIKKKTDIVELISGYLPLKKGGRNYKANCPFHNEDSPSFMVSPELQIFKCFGCGAAGDAFAFIKMMEGVEFVEALKMLADRAGVTLKSYQPSPESARKDRLVSLNTLAAEFYHYLLMQHRLGKDARDYLKKRGFTDETLKKFLIGYAPRSWDSAGKYFLSKKYSSSELLLSGLAVQKDNGRGYYDRFRGRIIFPIRETGGRTVGFSARRLSDNEKEPKYINTPETPVFQKGHFLYGLDLAKTAIKKAGFAIVVEGQTDMISPFQAGTENIVASLGTALTPEQIKLLRRYTEEAALCFDTDSAGDSAARRGLELAEAAGLTVKVIETPSPFKDPDECLRKDVSAWRQAVVSRVSVYDFLLDLTLKKHNPKTGEGQQKILREFLPILKLITSEVVQAHYRKKMAEALDVDEKLILADMKKIESSNILKARPSLPTDEAPSRAQKLEESVLRLAFFVDLPTAQNSLRGLSPSDFSSPERTEIFLVIKKYLKERKRAVDVGAFRDRLEGSKRELFEKIYFTAVINEGESGDRARELETTVGAVKEQTWHRELHELGLAIKKAEEEGQTKKLAELQVRFNEISVKLKKL